MSKASDERRLSEIIYTRAAMQYAEAKRRSDDLRLALDRAIARREAAIAAVVAEAGETGGEPVYAEVGER